MKYHIAFLAGLVAVLGLFVYVISLNEPALFYFHRDRKNFHSVLTSFRYSVKPHLEINFSSLYGGHGQLQVLHPLLDLRQLQIDKVQHLCRGDSRPLPPVTGREASCLPASDHPTKDFAFETRKKVEVLFRFLYEKEVLPADFLTSPPFLDPHGNSFAYLLVKKGPPPYNEKNWVERHLSYFKIPELKELLEDFPISNPIYSVIANLNESEVEKLVRGESLVLTPQYLLLKDQSRYGFSPLSYLVYNRSVFKNALQDEDFELVPWDENQLCLQREGNACWTYSSRYALAYLQRYSVAILALLGVGFLSGFGFYLRRLYGKNKEQQKHRLSLQVLSHEFRTPVSSMLLMMDQLRSGNSFDIEEQDLLTRLSNEIYRLQRIVEVSKVYLQAEGGRVHFKFEEIPSLNNWVTDFIEDSGSSIYRQLLDEDLSPQADTFWLKFILSSLVQNAFVHGAEPVSIRLNQAQSTFSITVQDQGRCEFKNLNSMTDAFVKSSQSQGMGLGLNIVRYIVEQWGGEIRFSSAPTTFTVSFSIRKKKEAKSVQNLDR